MKTVRSTSKGLHTLNFHLLLELPKELSGHSQSVNLKGFAGVISRLFVFLVTMFFLEEVRWHY